MFFPVNTRGPVFEQIKQAEAAYHRGRVVEEYLEFAIETGQDVIFEPESS